MKNDRISDKEFLSDEELDKVVGGSRSELYEIFKALEKRESESYGQMWSLRQVLDCVGSAAFEEKAMKILPDILQKDFSIDSAISLSGENQYRSNGGTLTHKQVLEMISGK